ncbi:MAG: Rieske 2Fe-2S domain-containing protein [Gemmatimonadota bacterium]|nr:Rieske 2Fe-2S domain-containing protein [Gemmatimonadota bacterium]
MTTQRPIVDDRALSDVASRSGHCDECGARAARHPEERAPALLDRRDFVKHGTIGAVTALLAAACGGAAGTTGVGTGGGGNTDLVVTVSNYPALATVGGIARVDSGHGTPVAAVRANTTTFLAFSLICPHFGCTVGIASGSFACPCHGARFASDGHWIGGQPTGNLTALNATFDSTTGTVTITG